MRFAGYVCALALTVGVVGFSVRDRLQGSQDLRVVAPSMATAEETPRLEATVAVAAEIPVDPAPSVAVPSTDPPRERLQEVRRSPEPQESRSWRRSSYRYPGPIPTPEEWVPPEGPVRIALQAGHWKANEAPAELAGIRDNGTRWQSKPEWEVNLEIAQRAGALLEEVGYQVDVLPAVVPPGYRAHLFVSIHADGSSDAQAAGYRVSAPRRDATGRAGGFVTLLEESYGKETGLRRLPDVTRRMSSYYAFNFRRYQHALHPMTIGVILETGYLTSAGDRRVILDDPDRAARGIVEAIKAFPETPPPVKVSPSGAAGGRP